MEPLQFDIRIAQQERTLVNLPSFTLRRNHLTVLFGESGIGKSLTAKAMMGLLEPDELRVRVNGEDYATYREKPLARGFREQGFFVFQEPSTHLNPLMSLEAQLTEGSLAGVPGRTSVLQTLWMDARAGELEELLQVYPKPHRPSGGEKQRALCAMAFIKMGLVRGAAEGERNSLFVFDEPTGSLDNRYRDVVLGMLLENFRRERTTILLITHDYSMISVLTRADPAVREQVVFEEMVLGPLGQAVREFRPETYTGWLREQVERRDRRSGLYQGSPVLRIESGVEVFGRTLTISRDRNGSTPVPLTLAPGSLVYLKAPSGTGKTTLVKILMGLIRGRNFRADLAELSLSDLTPRGLWEKRIWGRMMTMVFQHADEALNLHARVREVFAGLPGTRSWESIEEEVRRLLGPTADASFLQRRVSTLSGGQKQKLNLLRAMVLETNVLLLDEPLNGLDFASMKTVLEQLEERLLRGCAMLVISHNEEIFDAWVGGEEVYYLTAAPVSPSSRV